MTNGTHGRAAGVSGGCGFNGWVGAELACRQLGQLGYGDNLKVDETALTALITSHVGQHRTFYHRLGVAKLHETKQDRAFDVDRNGGAGRAACAGRPGRGRGRRRARRAWNGAGGKRAA